MYKTKIIESINEINKRDWNNLSESIYSSHKWMKLCEEEKVEDSESRHILLYKKNDLIAILPTFLVKKGAFFDLERYFSKKHKLILKLINKPIKKTLVAYYPLTQKSEIMSKQITSDEIKKLIEEMQKIARKEKANYVVYQYVSEKEEILDKILTKEKFSKAYYAKESIINLENSNNLEEYISKQKRTRRKVMKKDIKIFEESNARLEFSKKQIITGQEMIPLISNIYSKYKGRNVFTAEFLDKICKILSEKTRFVVVYKNNKKIGFNMWFKTKDKFESFKFGRDFEETKNNRTYFTLLFYEKIRQAIKENVKKINLGIETEQTKKTRGAEQTNLFLYIKSTDSIGQKILPFFVKRKEKEYKK